MTPFCFVFGNEFFTTSIFAFVKPKTVDNFHYDKRLFLRYNNKTNKK